MWWMIKKNEKRRKRIPTKKYNPLLSLFKICFMLVTLYASNEECTKTEICAHRNDKFTKTFSALDGKMAFFAYNHFPCYKWSSGVLHAKSMIWWHVVVEGSGLILTSWVCLTCTQCTVHKHFALLPPLECSRSGLDWTRNFVLTCNKWVSKMQ